MSAALAVLAACSWASPGADPYSGPVPAAIEAYADIPAPVRAKLRQRLEKRAYDDIALITRDGIVGKREYADLRGMHFGAGRVCQTVDRSAWTAAHTERGLIYCEAEHCIIVPTVCRNVARVTRMPAPAPAPTPTSNAPTGGNGLKLVDLPPVPSGGGEIQTVTEHHGLTITVPVPVAPVTFAGQIAPLPWPSAVPYYFTPMLPAPIPAIPEPSTWLMMLAGVAALLKIATTKGR